MTPRGVWCAALLLAAMTMTASSQPAQPAVPNAQVAAGRVAAGRVAAGQIAEGRRALAARDFRQAKVIFQGALRASPDSVEALTGEADAELGLHEVEAAEITYRRVTSLQPENWSAHKNLVIVEAALGRWEEFDRERALLHGARVRGARGIGWHENDVIDAFDAGGGRWIVRAYDDPPGRLDTRYNFERFESGRVLEYVSLEPAPGGDAGKQAYALNFYTGKAHGLIARFPDGEPSYVRLRFVVLRWLRQQTVPIPHVSPSKP